MLLLYLLIRSGVPAGTAGMLSLLVVAIPLYFMHRLTNSGAMPATGPVKASRFAVAVLLTVFLRAGVLAWMEQIPGSPAIVTAAVAALAAGVFIRAAAAIASNDYENFDGHVWSWRYPVTALLIYAVQGKKWCSEFQSRQRCQYLGELL